MAQSAVNSLEVDFEEQALALALKGAKLFDGFLGRTRCPASPQRSRRYRTRELQEGSVLSQVYDVVGGSSGEPALLPLGDGPRVAIGDLPADAVISIRVVRFFEDRGDEKLPWEQKLHNVNSGSLLWLPVHMMPKMHSVRGRKYGEWFTVHHVRILAKHLSSGYQMCNEGVCMAKTFGTSAGVKGLVSGEKMDKPYFWFVSPQGGSECQVDSDEHLQAYGWQHLHREGPFDGKIFVSEWRKQGSPMQEEQLQKVLQASLQRDP